MSTPETPSSGRRAPVTVVVLTFNEELNLPTCLESLRDWTREIFVVDSGSTDATVELAEKYGATVVSHPFESHAKQWNWALENLPLSSEWILALDADQRATPELAQEICDLLGAGTDAEGKGSAGAEGLDGLYIKRRQIFRGKWIKWGDYYPIYLLKLFRRGHAWSDEGELADHRFYVAGESARLESDMIEDNQNELDILMWMRKHVVYAGRQATEEFLWHKVGTKWSEQPRLFGTPNQRALWRKRLYYRLPLYLRAFIYFFYRYFLRFGFLDGKEGFIFHLFQALWYRLLVDVRLDELRKREESK